MGRQHQGMDRPGVKQDPEGSGEQGKMKKKTACKIICGAPTTLAVKGLMMMMMSPLVLLDAVLGISNSILARVSDSVLQLDVCQSDCTQQSMCNSHRPRDPSKVDA